jgi:hypothetical protein
MLGAFDNPEELDRPDLNKCPDCECFFAGEACPLCGKICPEEMRAGNRKPPKKAKRRRGGNPGRVTFVEWYHSWWCIILASIFMAPVGIILMITSPRRTLWKVLFIVAVVLVEFVLPYIFSLIFFYMILGSIPETAGLILPFLI